MVGVVRASACAVLISSFCLALTHGGEPIRGGLWVGGFGSLDAETLSWRSARLELKSDGDSLSGKLRTDNGRIFLATVTGDNDSLRISIERKRVRVFVGRHTDDTITASADDGDVPNKLVLRRIDPMSPRVSEQFAGVYDTSIDRRIGFLSVGTLLSMTDFASGSVRFLYPVGNDQFVSGPALAIPAPTETRYSFQRDSNGIVNSVVVKPVENEGLIAARIPGPRAEEFVYDSYDGTPIAGTLYLPMRDGPYSTFVWVHGSGRAARTGAGSWPLYLTDLGFAVLAVDKRGIGKSGGKYNLPDGGRDNFPHMRRRSKDVAAAVDALRHRDDIRGDRIGLIGASQAGWVIPMTTVHTDVQCAVILYGGATPLSVEGRYSDLASENESGAALKSVDQLIEELRSYEPSDVGIDKELAAMDFPALWIYGYRDRSNPSQLCVERIKRIGSENQRDFTIEIFPNGNHGLLECRFGGSAESLTLTRLVPGLYEKFEKWLGSNQLLPE